MSDTYFNAIVIGAGIEGSATAYQLAKTGHRTLLIEQFPLPHSRGSSHGQSRIIRKVYDEAVYTEMMKEAYSEWHDLEKQSGEQLLVPCGLVWVDNDSKVIDNMAGNLKHYNISHERLSLNEARQLYPMINLRDNLEVILDKEAGILKPDKCLQVLQMLFKKLGGVIRDGEMVEKINPADIVDVQTNKGQTYRAKSLVITAGPWANKLLRPIGLNLPLQPQRVGVYYWKEVVPGQYGVGKMPLFIDSSTGTHNYTLPCMEYPHHVKVCYHNGKDADPDRRDDINDEAIIKHLKNYVGSHFPLLENTPSIKEACMYTMTPDTHPVLDRHPHYSNIIIGAGFSGHGFKLAPVVGQVLTEMALNKEPTYDLRMFKVSRFGDKVKSRL